MLQRIYSPLISPTPISDNIFYQVSHGSVAIPTLLGGHKRSSISTSNPNSPVLSPLESALRSKIAELVNLVSAGNKELTTMRCENNALKEKISANEFNNANRTTTIAKGLFSLIQHIKTFPDVFSCVQEWVSYSDVKFLEHVKEFGGGELVDLLNDIIDKTHQLVRPGKPTPSIIISAPNVARIISIILHSVMPPGQWQFVPHWAWTWLVKVQSKSDRTVNIVSSLLSGSPASNQKLSYKFDAAADHITANEKFSETGGLSLCDMIFRWDNAPASTQGYVKKDKNIFDTLKTRIITLFETIFVRDMSDIERIPFTQSIMKPENDPSLWKAKFSTVTAAQVLAEDPEATKLIHEYEISNMKVILSQMHSQGYRKGDSLKVKTLIAKPTIRQLKKTFQSEIKPTRQAPQPEYMTDFLQSFGCFTNFFSSSSSSRTFLVVVVVVVLVVVVVIIVIIVIFVTLTILLT